MLRAPWYSGMAQGRALWVFVHLFEVTGDARWRTAADATFASMAQAPSGGLRYGSYGDSRRHLWIEEYPRYPLSMGENVLNGHIVAIWGLLAYWTFTRSPLAVQLTKGAISTVKATATNGFRRVGGSSLYSLRHKTPANTYHQMHIEQFLQLWQYTPTTSSSSPPQPPTAVTTPSPPRPAPCAPHPTRQRSTRSTRRCASSAPATSTSPGSPMPPRTTGSASAAESSRYACRRARTRTGGSDTHGYAPKRTRTDRPRHLHRIPAELHGSHRRPQTVTFTTEPPAHPPPSAASAEAGRPTTSPPEPTPATGSPWCEASA